MVSIRERVERKLLTLRNMLFEADADKIKQLDKMMKNSPKGHVDAQEWALQFSELLTSNVLDRISSRDIALILAGLISYKNTGITPQKSQLALVRAYENSSGILQEILHRILFIEEFEDIQNIKSSFFGDVSCAEINKILAELDDQGYVVLPKGLQSTCVDALVHEAKTFNYNLRDSASNIHEQNNRKIDPDNPPSCIAAYAQSSDLLKSHIFSELCNDPLLLHLSARNLGVKVNAIDSTLWYSFPSSAPSEDAAQLFHYDLDTLRWLKVFVYLTDVGPENGPHEYVPETHKSGSKPRQLQNTEYTRISDFQIDKYCAQKRKEICGERGTVILGDTRCFHKGNNVNSNYRLIFSPIYAPTKIGYFHGY
jgi:hypothetical protein